MHTATIHTGESNAIRDVMSHDEQEQFINTPFRCDWADPALAKIVRLRMLTDRGFPFYDVSYCWGVLKDGTKVKVDLPFSQLPKRSFGGGSYKLAILAYARRDGVYAKGLDIFAAISIQP